MEKSLQRNLSFEDKVRRTAEAIWSLESGEIQPEWYRNDPILHELDGIARLADVVHLLMVTTSTRLKKVQEDVSKLNRAERKEKSRGFPAKKWLVTEAQLSAEHIQYGKKNNVEVITFDNFRNRFLKGRDYISKRRNAAFGSSRNLRDGSIVIPDNEYIELPMTLSTIARFDTSVSTKSDVATSVADIIERLQVGQTICLIGPFGAGKSLTNRELFFGLSQEYLRRGSESVPVAINLREHWGAIYGDEILERHSRSIGFSPREALTAAWRAGIVHLLFDGFDEVATQAIARTAAKDLMRQTRLDALVAVRDLITKAPPGVGILLCGRDHYFDDLSEMRRALGLSGRNFAIVRIGEFTEEMAEAFLKRNASSYALPDWLPRKPLLLGYLAHQNLLDDILAIDSSRGFGFIWDSFLNLVCDREAEHDRATMDPVTIRRVLERLASVARSTSSGNGPITSIDLAESYRAETGEVAGEGVLMQLQRLPGLTPREQDPTARSFVDPDLLCALQGSALARSILESASGLVEKGWVSGLPRQGVAMAAYQLENQGFNSRGALGVSRKYGEEGKTKVEYQQLAIDSLMVAIELANETMLVEGRGILLNGGHVPELDLEDQEVKGITLRDCIIDHMFVGEGLTNSTIRFENCIIQKISGVPSQIGLPDERFSNCEFGDFDDASTNAAILRLDMPPGLKALMTILRKLYLQAGGGRKIAALKRGIPSGGPVFSLIEEALQILQTEGMVCVTGNVAHPVRRYTSRAQEILSGGALSNDDLVTRVKEL